MKNLWRIAQTQVHLPFLDRAQDTVAELGRGGGTLFLGFAAVVIFRGASGLYMGKEAVVGEGAGYGGGRRGARVCCAG